jgi:hypothetical protein
MSMSNPSRRIVWIAAALTFLLQLYLCGFFLMGSEIPWTIDINPGKYREFAFYWPPHSSFNTHNFLGFTNFATAFDPASLFSRTSVWIFFTLYFPLCATLALLFCYTLLRELDFSPAVATLGGLVCAWQGDLLSSIFPGHFAAASLWAVFPLALFFAIRAYRCASWFFTACCGACTGLMVLLLTDRGGLCSLVIGSYFLVQVFRHFPADPIRSLRILGQLICVVVLSMLVAAPGLLSILQTQVKDVERPDENIQKQYQWATQWSFAPEDIITYLIPGFMGWVQDDATGPYWGRIGQSQGWPEKHEGMRNCLLVTFSIGTVAFLLALFGVIHVMRPSGSSPYPDEQSIQGLFFAVVAGVAFVLALGHYTPIYFYIFKLPGMNTWRNPLKFLMPANLMLVLLAAYGAQAASALLMESDEAAAPARKRVLWQLGWTGLVLFAAWLLNFLFIVPLAFHLARLNFTSEQRATIFATINITLLVATTCATFLWLSWKILSKPGPFRVRRFINPFIQKVYDAALHPANVGFTWLVVCMFAIVGQMAWVQSHYVRLYDYKGIYSFNPLLQKMLPVAGEPPFRVKIEMSDPLLYELLSTVFPYYGVSSIDIDAISRMPSDYGAFFGALQANASRMMQLGGVRYWLMPAAQVEKLKTDPVLSKKIGQVFYYSFPNGRPQQGPSHALVELSDFLPKAVLIPELEVAPSRSDLLDRLKDPSWNPRQQILATAGEGVPVPALKEGKTRPLRDLLPVKITSYSDRAIQLEADTSVPAYLLINDRYDPGWKATVNGAPTTIFRADYILRGLALPAGHSKVVMNFEPLLYDRVPPALPIYIEMGTLLLLALAAVGRFVFRKRIVEI